MKKPLSFLLAVIFIFSSFYTYTYGITNSYTLYGSTYEDKDKSIYEDLDAPDLYATLQPFNPNLRDNHDMDNTLNVGMYNVHQYQETVYFNAVTPRINLTYRQIASLRLEQIGLSQEFLYTLPDEHIKIIATAEKAFVSNNFHTEEVIGDSSYLVPISRSEFLRRNEVYTNESILEEILSEINILEYGSEYLEIAPYWQWVERRVGGGTLWTIISLFPVQGGGSRYLAVADFFWTVMPSHRGTDFFGITRGEGYTVNYNTFRMWSQHERQEIMVTATVSHTFSSYLGTGTNFNNSVPNQISLQHGAAIRIDVPSNNIPQNMIPGTSRRGHISHSFRGGISYEGSLAMPGFNQDRNHFITYMHQNSSRFWGNPSISISFPWGISASLSPNPSGNYITITDGITTQWRVR